MKLSLYLQCAVGLASLLASFARALVQPTLVIAPAGNQSILYFPTTPTNYIIQSTTNIASSNWLSATDAIIVSAATVSNTLPAKFFRLFYADPPSGMALIPAGSFTIGNSTG